MERKHITALFQKSQPFFDALGDATRRELLLSMICGEVLSVKELANTINLSRPTISHHLRILKDAGIIMEHKEGRQTFYRLQPGEYFYNVKELIDTIDEAIKKEENAR